MLSRIALSVMIVVALAAFVTAVAVAEPNMQEGKWEIKGEVKMEGMPFPMPPMPVTYSTCLSKKDMVPQEKGKNQDCTTISTKVRGNTVTWIAKCKDKKGNVTDSTGSVTYKGAAFDSTVKNVMADTKGNKTSSTMTMSGKRVGSCK